MDPQTCEIPQGRHLAPHEFPDPVIVLDQGAPIAFGAPEEIQTNPRVLEAYLGG